MLDGTICPLVFLTEYITPYPETKESRSSREDTGKNRKSRGVGRRGTLNFSRSNHTGRNLHSLVFASRRQESARSLLMSVPGDPWCKLNPPEKVAGYFLVARLLLARWPMQSFKCPPLFATPRRSPFTSARADSRAMFASTFD